MPTSPTFAASPMPFGGMCHRTVPAALHIGYASFVTNAFRRDVSSDARGAAYRPQVAASPMPFGGMCHRTCSTTTRTRSPSPSPMPFGGMCHRTGKFERVTPADFVTNAFRRDVSSDPPKLPQWVRLEKGHQCLSAGCVIGRGHWRGDPGTGGRHQCLSAGCVIGLHDSQVALGVQV